MQIVVAMKATQTRHDTLLDRVDTACMTITESSSGRTGMKSHTETRSPALSIAIGLHRLAKIYVVLSVEAVLPGDVPFSSLL